MQLPQCSSESQGLRFPVCPVPLQPSDHPGSPTLSQVAAAKPAAVRTPTGLSHVCVCSGSCTVNCGLLSAFQTRPAGSNPQPSKEGHPEGAFLASLLSESSARETLKGGGGAVGRDVLAHSILPFTKSVLPSHPC